MDLKRLSHLVALADTGNFGRAATDCHLTQSAFSRSIQAAEDELGLQLFDRGTAGVSCTAAGRFVVERARRLVFEGRCLQRDVQLYREREVGSLAFGVGPYPAAAFAPRLSSELRVRFPRATLQIRVSNADTLAAALRAEELDFYLGDVRNIQVSQDLQLLKVGRLEAGFYVRPGHPLLAQRVVRGPMLAPYGLGSVRLPEGMRQALARVLSLPPAEPLSLAIECDDLNLVKHIGATTDTIVGCPTVAVAAELAAGSLVALHVAGAPPLYADIAVVSLAGRTLSPLAQYAVDAIRAAVAGT